MSTPTQRSLDHLRKLGYLAEVVEKRIPKVFITKDLFGFIDIIAIRDGEILAVQTTSGSNVAARITKIRESATFARVLAAGMRIEVHGWRKPTKTRARWDLRVENVER
jgi:predicted RecB family endonuclease